MGSSVTLGYVYDGYRAPAEPPAKSAMNPVTLGIAMSVPPPLSMIRLASPPAPASPAGLQAQASAPPVSAQTTPTPVVTAPATPAPNFILVTSGGGTASPSPAAVTAAPAVAVAPGASLTDQVAAWLSGTTPIGSLNVPNALLTGGVILGFALLMGGGKKR